MSDQVCRAYSYACRLTIQNYGIHSSGSGAGGRLHKKCLKSVKQCLNLVNKCLNSVKKLFELSEKC